MEKKQYYGLDILKLTMAVFVAARHMIQVFFSVESRWRFLIGAWLSNLAVPVFFIIAGFLLFRKIQEGEEEKVWRVTGSYCVRIGKLYLIWCVLYWPIDIYNWYHGNMGIRETVKQYVRSFFFSHTIAQLWYLPALIIACLLVGGCLCLRMKRCLILLLTGMLFVMGCIGDNWYFTEKLPQYLQQIIYCYVEHCVTMRNGVFYGSFYVALGLCLSRKQFLKTGTALIGSIFFLAISYLEVRRCGNINMVFSAAPAAYCLVEFALGLKLKKRRLYPRLRVMSEWIYLSHFYFFYLLHWTYSAGWGKIPLTEWNFTWMIFLPMLLFAWGMAVLSENPKFYWLKKAI